MAVTAPRLITCGWPDQADMPGRPPALVWIHAGDANEVTSAAQALPVGWLCLGVATVARSAETLRLEFFERYRHERIRLGDIVALVLDVFADGRHERLWAPRAELVAGGWEFAPRMDADGVALHSFAGPQV